jgi:hypothetical protein
VRIREVVDTAQAQNLSFCAVRYQAVSPIVVLANALEAADELLSLFVRIKFFIDQDRAVFSVNLDSPRKREVYSDFVLLQGVNLLIVDSSAGRKVSAIPLTDRTSPSAASVLQ